ncbi:MAG: hypothetical protein HFJ72_08290 [Adlercreutzia sp.]|nr:hypothetical protein [Adlercreutzia sp.]
MRKLTDKFVGWCADNSPAAKLERTVAQGVLAAVAVGVTTGQWGSAFGVAVIMAILSPIQAQIGEADEPDGKHAKTGE